MTPHQQAGVYDPNSVADTLYFETMEEYMEWATRRASH